MSNRDASLHYGWLPNFSLGEFLEHNRRSIATLPLVLVRSIDSETAVSEMPWVKRQLDRDASWAVTTNPLIVSGDRLLRAARQETIFSGFDEIWVPKDLPVSGPPVEANLVAPRMFDLTLPDEVREWMRTSAWRLGLGDGDGLNYVVSDHELARQLGLPITREGRRARVESQ